jgi:hypothetical protein
MKWYTLGLWLVWLIGPPLEGLILVRSLIVGWFRKCPFFSAYLTGVFIQDVLLLAVYIFKFKYYPPLYWYAEFFTLLLGCGVTWEIVRLVLGRYPGAGRMARNVLLFLLFMALAKALSGDWQGEETWGLTFVELDRNLRVAQALSLIVLILIVTYYRIPLGRYAKGIFAGYGIFIAAILLSLTLRTSVGRSFQGTWVLVQPLSYAVALGIWCVSLWGKEQSLEEELQPRIEQDYQLLALLTRRGLVQAREFLGKAIHP